VELAIDFQIQLYILDVLWNGSKRRVTRSYQLWFGANESVGITATLCVDFILPARTNVAVPSIQLSSFSSPDLLPVIVKKY
jgi:hypothetical protein